MYMTLMQHHLALKDMQQALSYSCSDIDGNVKRLSRLLRCYAALGNLEGEEVDQAILHMENQLVLLEGVKKSVTVYEEGRMSLNGLKERIQLLQAVHLARNKAEWQPVLESLSQLTSMNANKKDMYPEEWTMIKAEALGMLGRVEEASELVS